LETSGQGGWNDNWEVPELLTEENGQAVNGAEVGDLYMSLIHTAELCGATPFDYLTKLQRHVRELAVSRSARRVAAVELPRDP